MKSSGINNERRDLIPAELRSGSIILRPVAADDIDWLDALRHDPEVEEFLGAELDDGASAVDDNICGDSMHFIIVTDHGDRVGYICAYPDADCYPSMDRWYIYFAVSSRFRCKGYATEALNLLTEYLFQEFAFPRAVVDMAMVNSAARRVAEKCGYVKPSSRFAYIDRGRLRQGVRFAWYRIQSGRRAMLSAKGKQLYDRCRFTEAVQLWHQALSYQYDRTTPYTDFWIVSNLGMAYSSAGLYVAARQWLERAEVLAAINGVAHSYILRELAWIDRITCR